MLTGDTATGTGVEERLADRIGPGGVTARGVDCLAGDNDLSKWLREEVCTKHRLLESTGSKPTEPTEPMTWPEISTVEGGGGVAALERLPWQWPT